MVLYLIGIGLFDEKDITVRGLEIVRQCKYIYLEIYTSKLSCSIEKLEELYGKEIILADRNLIENRAETEILAKAKDSDVAVLIIGDVFSATTHADLRARAIEKNIQVHIVHNASVLTAVGIIGLELYKFGKVTSIPFANSDIISPITAYDANKKIGLHTLFLLDLNPSENRYMTINDGLNYLTDKGIPDKTICVGAAALGSEKPDIFAGTISKVKNHKFIVYPQCFVIPGDLHFVEEECLELWKHKSKNKKD